MQFFRRNTRFQKTTQDYPIYRAGCAEPNWNAINLSIERNKLNHSIQETAAGVDLITLCLGHNENRRSSHTLTNNDMWHSMGIMVPATAVHNSQAFFRPQIQQAIAIRHECYIKTLQNWKNILKSKHTKTKSEQPTLKDIPYKITSSHFSLVSFSSNKFKLSRQTSQFHALVSSLNHLYFGSG